MQEGKAAPHSWRTAPRSRARYCKNMPAMAAATRNCLCFDWLTNGRSAARRRDSPCGRKDAKTGLPKHDEGWLPLYRLVARFLLVQDIAKPARIACCRSLFALSVGRFSCHQAQPPRCEPRSPRRPRPPLRCQARAASWARLPRLPCSCTTRHTSDAT